MQEEYTFSISDEKRAELRAQRAARRKARIQAQRRRRLQQLFPILILLAALIILFVVRAVQHPASKKPADQPEIPPASVIVPEQPSIAPQKAEPYEAVRTKSTIALGESIDSSYAILIDLQKDTILAEKASQTVISPASMTKIMTLLVAAENLRNLTDTVTITREMTDYCFINHCSVVGYMVDETPTVRELLYGTILPSGADAALALATYISGTQEAFVALMNARLEELGVSQTAHFTNCVGLYDEAHGCTVYDMALIMKAAMENDLCCEVLSTHIYKTAPTDLHPEGQNLSNLFLRRIEDHDTQQAVRAVGAKTGYVFQSGSCAASWGEDAKGNQYICVTGDAASSWRAIYDHVAIYQLCPEP